MSGCGQVTSEADMKKAKTTSAISSPDQLPKETFVAKEGDQDAIFYIGQGYTGGAGSAPLIDKNSGSIKQLNGKPIFLEESAVGEVLKKGKIPNCVEGRPYIAVNANISLDLKVTDNPSIEDAPKMSYYVAHVKELHAVTVLAKECK